MFSDNRHTLIPTGEATAILPVAGGREKPVTVIGTEAIRATFDAQTLQQAINTRLAPGVAQVVLNPDAHVGFGAPIGCVMASDSHIYPGPVGVDIKCSMSLLQLDVPADAIGDRRTRRTLIDAICERTPTGAGRGQRSVPKSRPVSEALGRRVAVEGASAEVCEALGIPARWAARCEDAFHLGHGDTRDGPSARTEATRFGKRCRGPTLIDAGFWSSYFDASADERDAFRAQARGLDLDPARQLWIEGTVIADDAPPGRDALPAREQILLGSLGDDAQEDAGAERAGRVRAGPLGEPIAQGADRHHAALAHAADRGVDIPRARDQQFLST